MPDVDDKTPRHHPRLCLSAIYEMLKRIPNDPTDHSFQALAAGPLESLLFSHGVRFVDESRSLHDRARRSTCDSMVFGHRISTPTYWLSWPSTETHFGTYIAKNRRVLFHYG